MTGGGCSVLGWGGEADEGRRGFREARVLGEGITCSVSLVDREWFLLK